MHLEIAKGADPLSVGEEATYTFNAINQGDGIAQTVVLTVAVPDELEVLKDKLEPTARLDGQTVTFSVPALAAGSKGTFVLKVRALKPGDVRLTAKLLCDQMRQGGPLTSEETTTIVADTPGK